jgi:tetratricopeptide (TPR) repeat protein
VSPPSESEPGLDHSQLDRSQRRAGAPPPGNTTRPLPPGYVLPLPSGASAGPSIPVIPGYQVLGEIARGGMGAIYRARHPTLGREVAIKVLVHDTSAEDLERFRREAQALARLQHPNIVPVHDRGQVDGRPFIVMDLVDGETLYTRVQRSGPLESREAGRIALALARALEHTHSHDIVHRDVKPANVLLRGDGVPLLTDFGLARLDEQQGLTMEGTALGTPNYMAPEQARGDGANIDRRADVYGLGATLYELLAGRAPFQGGTVLETMLAVVERAPASPLALRPSRGSALDLDLEAVCLKCLAKAADARYPSAHELADDLERALRGEETRARPWSSAERLRRPLRRPVWGAAILATVALVVGLAGAWVASARAALRRADARARFHAAAVDHERGAREGAPRALDAALELDPALADAWAARGAARLRQGDLAGAKADLDRALTLDAGLAEAWAARAALCVATGAPPEQVEADASEALRLDPDLAAARVTRGEVRARGGDLAGALEDAERAAAAGARATSEQRARALVLRATVRATRVQAGVEDDLKAALEADAAAVEAGLSRTTGPAAITLRLARARLLEQRGDVDGALADVARVLEADAQLATGWELRGRLLRGRLAPLTAEDFSRGVERGQGEVDRLQAKGLLQAETAPAQECRRALDRALELDPTLVDARCERAALRVQTSDLRGAMGDWAEALTRDPDRVDALLGRGFVVFMLTDDKAAAAGLLARAVALRPDATWGWVVRGSALNRLGRQGEAIVCFTRAIALDPQLFEAWNFRGVSRRQTNDLQGALEDYTRALTLRPSSANAWTNRAIALHLAGEHRGAISDADRSLEVDPGFFRAYLVRGRSRLALGLTAEGRADLQQFVTLAPNDGEAADARALLERTQ